MPPVGFDPTFSAGKRPYTNALGRAATGTGCLSFRHMHSLQPLILKHSQYICFLGRISTFFIEITQILTSHKNLHFLSICPVFFLTAVAVFRKRDAISLCFSIDLVPNFLLSWLLVLYTLLFKIIFLSWVVVDKTDEIRFFMQDSGCNWRGSQILNLPDSFIVTSRQY